MKRIYFIISGIIFVVLILSFIGFRVWEDYKLSIEICKIEYEKGCEDSADFHKDILKSKTPLDLDIKLCLETECKHQYFKRIKSFLGF